MNCPNCRAEGKHFADESLMVCWCGYDVCNECVKEHVAGCEFAAGMKVKHRPAQSKKDPLPRMVGTGLQPVRPMMKRIRKKRR